MYDDNSLIYNYPVLFQSVLFICLVSCHKKNNSMPCHEYETKKALESNDTEKKDRRNLTLKTQHEHPSMWQIQLMLVAQVFCHVGSQGTLRRPLEIAVRLLVQLPGQSHVVLT